MKSDSTSQNNTTFYRSRFAILLLASTPLIAQQVGLIQRTVSLPEAGEFLLGPETIATGSDGALWFTDGLGGNIDRMTTTGALTVYPIPTSESAAAGITRGPDDALWFTEENGNKIGRITTGGMITEYPLPEPNSNPNAITAGPDGALWFTEAYIQTIGRISTSGAITEFPISGYASGICTGPDGALWFTQYDGSQIGRITTTGEATYFDAGFATYPLGITTGPDGALWFAAFNNGTIGRITTAGVLTSYFIPEDGETLPQGISRGPDDELWFTLAQGIGSITTAGVITIYPVPYVNPYSITRGPGGMPWYLGTNIIGQVVLTTAELTTNLASGDVDTPITLTGSGYKPNEDVKLYADDNALTYMTSVSTDSTGGFIFTDRIKAVPGGYNAFVGTGQSSGKIGIAAYNVTQHIVITPETGLPGSLATVNGYGFNLGDLEVLYWGDSLNVQLGSAPADENGSFISQVTIPPSATPGTYTVFCYGDGNSFIKTRFVVQ